MAHDPKEPRDQQASREDPLASTVAGRPPGHLRDKSQPRRSLSCSAALDPQDHITVAKPTIVPHHTVVRRRFNSHGAAPHCSLELDPRPSHKHHGT